MSDANVSDDGPDPRIESIIARSARAQELSDAGRHAEAEQLYRQDLARGYEDAWLDVGNELFFQGRNAEAAQAYLKAAAIPAQRAVANFNLAGTLERLGDLKGAIDAYEIAGSLGDPDALVNLAFLFYETGDRSKAKSTVVKAARLGSEYADAVAATWEWQETGSPALADRLRIGVQLFAPARAALGEIVAGEGDTRGAVEILREGMQKGETESTLSLGNLYLDMGDEAAAEDAYRAGVSLGDIPSEFNLAKLLYDSGRAAESREHLMRAAASGDQLAIDALRDWNLAC